MWIHLLSLGLVDGAGGGLPPAEETRNGAGFAWHDRRLYKYKYKIPEDALQAIETAAQESVEAIQIPALQTTLERLGVVYHDAYRQAFLEILAQLKAEKAQEAEDEQIVQIIAALM